MPPIRACIAGLGGYAASHHHAIRELELAGRVKLRATCDPCLDQLGDNVASLALAARRVEMFADFDEMLSRMRGDCDLLTVAAPIHLHAPMHAAARRNGLACYLEKPPTLDPIELEDMVAIDRAATFRTQVGFGYLFEPACQRLKERIVAGEFGRLLRASFLGLWPRPRAYFGRSPWAGRLMLHDRLLLDSCCGNAMSHHLNRLLFLAGIDDLHAWAEPAFVEAELYRANAIEGADTVFARSRLNNGVELQIAASHACDGPEIGVETLEFERATVELHRKSSGIIRFENGKIESLPALQSFLVENIRTYLGYLEGKLSRPPILLEDCRAFVSLNGLLYLAAEKIASVPPDHLRLQTEAKGERVAIRDIEQIAALSLQRRVLPSDLSVPWAQKGRVAPLSDLPRLLPAIQRLQMAN